MKLLDLDGKRISLLSDLIQEVFVHWGLGRVLPRGGIHLDAMDPDISPEGQPDHIQVLASVAEGTGEVDVHCRDGDIFRVPACTGAQRCSGFGYLSCRRGPKGQL